MRVGPSLRCWCVPDLIQRLHTQTPRPPAHPPPDHLVANPPPWQEALAEALKKHEALRKKLSEEADETRKQKREQKLRGTVLHAQEELEREEEAEESKKEKRQREDEAENSNKEKRQRQDNLERGGDDKDNDDEKQAKAKREEKEVGLGRKPRGRLRR